jgi:hypothetical protein
VSINFKKGVLRCVLGEMKVAQHGVGASVSHVLKARHELDKRCQAASLPFCYQRP